MQDCLLYLLVNRSTYNNDVKRIAFVLSHMTEKEAALWKHIGQCNNYLINHHP